MVHFISFASIVTNKLYCKNSPVKNCSPTQLSPFSSLLRCNWFPIIHIWKTKSILHIAGNTITTQQKFFFGMNRLLYSSKGVFIWHIKTFCCCCYLFSYALPCSVSAVHTLHTSHFAFFSTYITLLMYSILQIFNLFLKQNNLIKPFVLLTNNYTHFIT